MTRGRKKDLTIPPTRSLLQQRDYRARKANYVATLEERCRKAEEENVQLRQELLQMRAHLTNSAVILPETAEASNELMKALAAASASLLKFQQLAFSGTSNSDEVAPLRSSYDRELEMDRQTSQETRASPLQGEPSIRNPISYGRKRLFRDDSPQPLPAPHRTPSTPISSPSNAEGSECCGGLVDCDALDSDGIIEHESDEDHGLHGTRIRLSGLRSTSMTEHR